MFLNCFYFSNQEGSFTLVVVSWRCANFVSQEPVLMTLLQKDQYGEE